jgi:hypothetical protein
MDEKKEEKQIKWLKTKSINLSKDKKRVLVFTESGEAVSLNVGLLLYILKGGKNVSSKPK